MIREAFAATEACKACKRRGVFEHLLVNHNGDRSLPSDALFSDITVNRNLVSSVDQSRQIKIPCPFGKGLQTPRSDKLPTFICVYLFAVFNETPAGPDFINTASLGSMASKGAAYSAIGYDDLN